MKLPHLDLCFFLSFPSELLQVALRIRQDQALSNSTADPSNMKSFQTMILMFDWPVLLTAMGVSDLSKIIGRPVSTTESYAKSWSHFTEHDPPLHQQEVSRSELETRYPSNVWRSGSQMEPHWPDTHLFNAPSSDAHTKNIAEGTWFEDQLESPGHYSELNHVMGELPGIKPDLRSWLDQLSAADFDGDLHNDGFHSSSPYNSVTGLRGHSEVQTTYHRDPLAISTSPHNQFSQSSSGHHIPAEHPIAFLDSDLARMLDENENFSFDSQTLNKEPAAILHDTSSHYPVSQAISSIENAGRPHETFKDASDHVAHGTPRSTWPTLPISEATLASESSPNYGLRDSPSASDPNPLLQFLSPATHFQEDHPTPGQLFRSGQLKRPFTTEEVEFQSSKHKTRQNPSSFDAKEGFISQVQRYRPSIHTDLPISASSDPPNKQPSWLQFEPHTTPELDSEPNHISKLKEHDHEGNMSDDPVDLEIHQSNIKSIAKYYGKSWHREGLKKEILLQDDAKLGVVKLGSSYNHQSILPKARDIIDGYQPEIKKFLDLFSVNRIKTEHIPYLELNMKELLDNFLDIVTICSEVVSSIGLHTNMEEDVRDGYQWFIKTLAALPDTPFEYLPLIGNTKRLNNEKLFDKEFHGLSPYAGTVFWLSHRFHIRRRETVGASLGLAFMLENRKHWLKYLTSSLAVNVCGKKLCNIYQTWFPKRKRALFLLYIFHPTTFMAVHTASSLHILIEFLDSGELLWMSSYTNISQVFEES
ncbi:uncharacterized protein MELLADRAFT_62494 [Melampsora larici-populina 98AG31]|uniref:Uncharacterized protein n=1 Tax=Melampsora larici-populina (strain 98AG31 / pathotype 3-4-7) TaxID=747676 RepID=F4RJ65_MELLP|nr:uncharacterized protein MELLADRAFT_62494 [Melampsora larici-populina 98AG31]EGG07678.1 hypothetical protein MELLADRAFT_62494 [Melampsora larici-populina 98AG31]